MLINMVLPGAVETARLPKEYQEVEYIESTGTQYIDTGIKGKTGLVASGAIMLTASQTSIALGCYGPQRCYMLSFNAGVPRYGYVDWYNGSSALAINTKYDFEVSFLQGSQYLKLNGSTIISSANATAFTNNYNVFLFAYCDATAGAGDFAKIRCYPVAFTDNGTLVAEFIPCYRKADNLAGAYNLTTGEFHPCLGTGNLIVGPDKNTAVIPKPESPSEGDYSFTYSGNYTDNRVNGKGTVRLNTSGVFVFSGEPVTVTVYIQGAGGGAAVDSYDKRTLGTGGGGGYQTITVTLEQGTYEIVIGTGGEEQQVINSYNWQGSNGGDTMAFGYTSTGGTGGRVGDSIYAGTGGSPNGGNGAAYIATGQETISGGSPNGGGVINTVSQPGGDGYVELTFI